MPKNIDGVPVTGILGVSRTDREAGQVTSTVPESPGMPVTGSPSMLKGYDNSFIDGSPSILVNTPPLRRALHNRANE